MTSQTIPRWWPLVVVLPAVLVYLPGLGTYFLADDFSLFIRPVDWSDWRSVLLTNQAYVRPIPGALIRLEHALWGLRPWPMHLASVLLHAGCTALVALLALRLSGKRGVALASGLCFGLHPVNVQVVSWVSCTFELCFGVFALGCLVSYHAFRESGRRAALAGALFLFACALLSKEPAVAILPALVAYELVLRRRLGGLALVPFAAVLAAYLALRYHLFGGLGGRTYADGTSIHLDLGSITLRGLLLQTFRPLLLPFNSAWWQGRERILAVLLAVALAALPLAVLRARPRPAPRLVAFGALFGLILFAPAATLIQPGPHADLSQSRFLYLPAVGFCLVLGALLGPALDRRSGRLLLGLFACLYAVATSGNARAWQAAGRISRTVLASIAKTYPALPPEALLVIEDPPSMHRGAFVFLRSNALNHAVRLTHPRPPPLSVCHDQIRRYVDMRAFRDPERGFVARWDAGRQELVDETARFREAARRERAQPVERIWEGMNLLEWHPPGMRLELDGEEQLGLARGVVGHVALESPSLDAGVGCVVVEVCHPALAAPAGARMAQLAWRYAGEGREQNQASFLVEGEAGCHRYTLLLPLRRVAGLLGTTLDVRIVFPEAAGLGIRSIRALPFEPPGVVRLQSWGAFHRKVE
jgi:hypothetical protein